MLRLVTKLFTEFREVKAAVRDISSCASSRGVLDPSTFRRFLDELFYFFELKRLPQNPFSFSGLS